MPTSRRIRRGRPGQRGARQAPRLDAGLTEEAGGGRRAAVRRRLLPEHRLPAEQERHPRRQGRRLLPQRRRVRDRARRLEGRHGRRPRPQAEDGRRAGRDAPREVPGERRGARHGAAGASWRRGPSRSRSTTGGTRTLRGQNVVINTGSRARLDDTPGLAEAGPLTHVEALELDRLPEHLIVLGGGYVGLELAQAFRRFGSRVTVVERNGALIHREDADVTEAVERAPPRRGDRDPDRHGRRSRRGEVRRVRPPAHGAAARSRGRTCSSPAGARRTPTASAWNRSGWRWTSGGTSRSTSGCGRRPRACGRRATAPAAPTSRISARTTSACCWPTSPAGTA